MVDWKYGAYSLAWWLPVTLILSCTAYFFNGLLQLVLLIAEGVFIIILNSRFEKKYPQVKHENRETTISHLRGICVCVALVLLLVLPEIVPKFYGTKFSDIFPVLCIVFCDILISLFSSPKKEQ